jgi:hypothetical protein
LRVETSTTQMRWISGKGMNGYFNACKTFRAADQDKPCR